MFVQRRGTEVPSASQITHRRGVTSVPGLYVLGLKFMYRRNSSFIDGVASDARFVAAHMMMRRMTARARAAADHDARELSA